MGLTRLVGLAVVLAGCGKPFWKSPPPAPEPRFPASLLNAELDSVKLIQEPCMAPCPTYSYVLRGNGTAEFEGREHTPMLGRYTAPLAPASFDSIVRLLREKHFLQMARVYAYPATDQTSVITRAFLADTVKEVERYGDPADAPRELYQIEAAIQRLGANLHWHYLGPSLP